MSVLSTPVYGIAYCDDQTQIKDIAGVTASVANTLEAALLARGIPPADLQALIAAGWFSDTSFTFPAYGGFTFNGIPKIRKLGKTVRGEAGWTNAGLAINSSYVVEPAGTIPTAFRPTNGMYQPAGTAAGAQTGEFVIGVDGSVTLRTGAVLSTYYRLDSCAWFVA